ncbi:hypothetical protein LTR36_009979 [Oleoguttula mirabilis]|uniref:F-box domain-containing protein n=1 Tax=Oleoguttula mirabilis TaxID=1507867 RepID=A0AAV9J507_9PEZI|nr:hypothetical protein LTR36_009979 [Oleoguttula mirabilis]
MAFPEEVLQTIFENLRVTAYMSGSTRGLGHREQVRILQSISLADKTFNRIVQPIIYRRLTFSICIYPAGTRGTRYMQHLLNVFAERPETARLVAEIVVEDCPPAEDEGTYALGRATIDKLVAVAEGLALPLSLRQRLQSGLAQGLHDAGLALLLCMCTGLEVLGLTTSHEFKHTLTSTTIAVLANVDQPPHLSGSAGMHDKRAVSDIRPLQRLREVGAYYVRDDDEGSTDIGLLFPLLQLPAMDLFTGSVLSCRKDSDFASVTTSTLKRLDLREVDMDASGLDKILTTCPLLEVLSVDWGTSCYRDFGVRFEKTGDSLRMHSTALQRLSLERERVGTGDYAESPPLGSLQSWTSLRFLSVPLAALLGCKFYPEGQKPEPIAPLQHTLPFSLEELEIHSCDGFADEALDGLDMQVEALIRDARFAELRTIRIRDDTMRRSKRCFVSLTVGGWTDSKARGEWRVLERVE